MSEFYIGQMLEVIKPVNKEEKLISKIDKALLEIAQSDSMMKQTPYLKTNFEDIVGEIMTLKILAGIPLLYNNKEDYLKFYFGRED